MENNDLSAMLQGLMADPELMKKVSSVASSLGIGDIPAPKEEKEENTGEKKEEKDLRLPAPKLSSRDADRRRLISAIKPYLNPERREKADMLLTFMTLMDTGILGDMFKKGDNG